MESTGEWPVKHDDQEKASILLRILGQAVNLTQDSVAPSPYKECPVNAESVLVPASVGVGVSSSYGVWVSSVKTDGFNFRQEA